MTLLEDVQAEYEGMLGEPMTHFPANEPVDEGDDFWYKEDGWDKQSGTSFTGVVQRVASSDVIENAGFDEETTSVIRTGFDGVETGDLIEYGSKEWVVTGTTPLREQGADYTTLIAVKELE